MREQQRQEKAFSLLLPPIRLYERSRTTNQLINQYMNLIQNKKSELQRHLNDKESYNNDHQLEYIRDSLQQAKNRQDIGNNNQAYQQQLMARGGLQEEKVYVPPTKTNLLKKDFTYSTIEPKASKAFKFRMASKVETFQQKQEIGQSQGYGRHRRYQTEPHRKQDPSPVDKYRLFPFKYQQSIKQRKADSRCTDRQQIKHQQSIIYVDTDKHQNEHENDKDIRGEVQTENFSPIRIFEDQKEQNLEKRVQESQIKQFISLQKKSQLMNPQSSVKFMQFYQSINALKKSTKTNQRLQKAVLALQGFNPFFKKVQKVVGVCLLRIGKILKKQTQFPLYQLKVPYRNFFIILAGKVEIRGKQKMRKICQTGQTLLQEILFEQNKNSEPALSLEKAKLVQESWLLQVDLNELIKLQKQLIRYGFRRGLNEFKNILKRNYIVKNWLRSKFKHINSQ